MVSRPEGLRERTKSFAVRIVKLAHALPNTPAGWVIAKQVLRSGTSAAANYRAACRARSKAEFIAKISMVEEIDEALFWLELLVEAKIIPPNRLEYLIEEANQLTAIFVTARKTSRSK